MISRKVTVEQNSGTTAMRVNGVQNVAVVLAYTTLQCGSMVTPMPTAGPFTAATI